MSQESREIENQSILSFKHYVRFLPFNGLLFLSSYMVSAFISGYGAAWFSGCKSIKEDNNCDKDLNYDEYNIFLQISNSILGLLSFIFAGMIGHLSDIYGRKIFLYFQLFTNWIPYIPMLFYNNMYLFLGLRTLVGLNGSVSILCPAHLGYIADSLPQNQRLKGFSTIYIMGGISLLSGTLATFAISSYINDHFNFYVINILFVITLVYLTWIVKPLPNVCYKEISIRDKFNIKHHYNPFGPLKYLCSNSVVLWISLSSSLVTLQATGLIDICIVVFSDVLNSSESQSNLIAMMYLIGSTAGLIAGPIIVLPLFEKCNLSEYNILLITIFLAMVNSLAMCSIVLIKQIWLVAASAFIAGISYLSIAAYNSILTAYCNQSEKGLGFGVMFACNGITSIIAPFAFALLYQYLKNHNIEYMVFVFAFFLALIGFIMCIPLKIAINNYDDKQEINQFNDTTLSLQRHKYKTHLLESE
eukprot:174074_1